MTREEYVQLYPTIERCEAEQISNDHGIPFHEYWVDNPDETTSCNRSKAAVKLFRLKSVINTRLFFNWLGY